MCFGPVCASAFEKVGRWEVMVVVPGSVYQAELHLTQRDNHSSTTLFSFPPLLKFDFKKNESEHVFFFFF